jgi:hypothetical protein
MRGHILAPKKLWLPLRAGPFNFRQLETDEGIVPGYSSSDLEKFLRIESGATNALILPDVQKFSFDWPDGSKTLAAHPWDILDPPPNPEVFREQFYPPYLDDEGDPQDKLHRSSRDLQQRVKRGTCAVWEVMLSQFAVAVRNGYVMFFARADTPEAPFKKLSPDQWSICKVKSWTDGVLLASGGISYFSVHLAAAPPPRQPKTPGRKKIFDPSLVWPWVVAKLEEVGPPGPKQELDWQDDNDLANFVYQKFEEILARPGPQPTTLKDVTRELLAEYKRGNRSRHFGR